MPSCTQNSTARRRRLLVAALLLLLVCWARPGAGESIAGAQQPAPTIPAPVPVGNAPTAQPPATTAPAVAVPAVPTAGGAASPAGTTGADGGGLDIKVDLDSGTPGQVPSNSVVIILGLTVLSLAPSLLILMTSFTRIAVVLGLTRNALGVQQVPPNQVLVGLAMFLSLFVMAPTLKQVNDQALQPYLRGEMSQSAALKAAEQPIKGFMLANTRTEELDTMMRLRGDERPAKAEDTSLITLIPAFIISELKAAFIIGIVIFVPFLVIDLVVSAALMSLGMMMLPPVFVSLPMKLLLFVMVDGWSLVASALVKNYQGFT